MEKACSIFFTVGEINLFPIKQQGSLVGFASCVINGWFYCGGIGIHSDMASRGYKITYPTKMLKNGESVPIFHPLSKPIADQIQAAITAEWERLISS